MSDPPSDRQGSEPPLPGDRRPWSDGRRRSRDGRPPWGDGPPPWVSRRWGGRQGDWHQYAGRGRWRWAGGAPWFLGCALVALVLAFSLVIAVATWLATALIGVVAPSASPPVVTAVAIAIVLVVAVAGFGRLFGTAVRPLADIAAATERLADGEPGVRVDPRGPGPVRRLAGSFNIMAERLDRSRDDRRALLADVTHELRTPLTVVQGGLEAMLDGVHPMDEDHLAPVLAETVVMARLVDDLRTLSLADAGALTLHREPADVAALAREVVAANAPMAAAKGVDLASGGQPRVVANVDPVRIREVVGNLVQNAMRYTPSGGRVQVEVERLGDEVLITVRDTGAGISAEDLPKVFDRFQRHADTGGTGLGLAIVRDLVAAHGGTVTAESDGVAGHGSTFRVALPTRE